MQRTVRSGSGSTAADLAVFERGDDGPVVLFAHGYPDTHAVWDELDLPGHRVVTFDQRGFGDSTGTGLDLATVAADVIAVADAVSPDRPVHLVGHDWGSITAWAAAGTAPARFATLTSISGPPPAALARLPWPKRLRQMGRSWYMLAIQVPVVPELVFRTLVAPRWTGILRRDGVRAPRLAPTFDRDVAHGLGFYRANVLSRRRVPRPPASLPVLVLHPSRDPFVGRDIAAAAASWSPTTVLTDIDAGHWAPLGRPDLVADAIRAHITAHPA